MARAHRALPILCAYVLVSGALASSAAHAQRVGQNATVQFGVVRSAEEVQLDSNAAQGALVGGTLGLVTGGGRSSRSARNAIIGATAGSMVGAASDGSRKGFRYTVEKTDGSSTTIVTDQREIREGDCVAVERVGNTANIRRASASYCEKANQQAVRSVDDAVTSEALGCQSAKQELVDATTKEQADLAARKIELLCNG